MVTPVVPSHFAVGKNRMAAATHFNLNLKEKAKWTRSRTVKLSACCGTTS
jgi:hypothetical protein